MASIEIIITTASTVGAPITGAVTVARGIMTNIHLYFAQGVQGSNLARIFNGANQLFPRTSGTSFRLVNPPIQVYDEEPLTDVSTEITLKGWADGALNPHRLILNFDVLPFDRPELII